MNFTLQETSGALSLRSVVLFYYLHRQCSWRTNNGTAWQQYCMWYGFPVCIMHGCSWVNYPSATTRIWQVWHRCTWWTCVSLLLPVTVPLPERKPLFIDMQVNFHTLLSLQVLPTSLLYKHPGVWATMESLNNTKLNKCCKESVWIPALSSPVL